MYQSRQQPHLCCQKLALTVFKQGEFVFLFNLQDKRAFVVGIRLNCDADPVLSHPQIMALGIVAAD